MLKQVIQQGRREEKTGGVLLFTRPPRARRDGLCSQRGVRWGRTARRI